MSESDPPPDGELWKETPPNQESIEALAQLVAMTNAELTDLDGRVTDGSNLKAKTWNPEAIIQREVQAAAQAGTLPQPQPAVNVPPAGMHPEVHAPAPPPPSIPQPNNNMQQLPYLTDPQVIERLEKIENDLSKLQITFDNILKNMLKNKTKQITIRFDDTKNSK